MDNYVVVMFDCDDNIQEMAQTHLERIATWPNEYYPEKPQEESDYFEEKVFLQYLRDEDRRVAGSRRDMIVWGAGWKSFFPEEFFERLKDFWADLLGRPERPSRYTNNHQIVILWQSEGMSEMRGYEIFQAVGYNDGGRDMKQIWEDDHFESVYLQHGEIGMREKRTDISLLQGLY